MITDNIMFIHIPKTAGTSIIKTLSNKFNWQPLIERRKFTIIDANSENNSNVFEHETKNTAKGITHNPLFLLETKNDISKFYTFAVTRNPYKRSYSLYKFYQKIYKDGNLDGIKAPEKFEDFLLEIKGKLNKYDISHFRNKMMLVNVYQYTQSFFVKNSKNEIGVDKIYKLENIIELENDFDVKLPKENTGSYTESDYINDYTPRCIELVQEIYHEDFINFNYSLDFNEVKPNELH